MIRGGAVSINVNSQFYSEASSNNLTISESQQCKKRKCVAPLKSTTFHFHKYEHTNMTCSPEYLIGIHDVFIHNIHICLYIQYISFQDCNIPQGSFKSDLGLNERITSPINYHIYRHITHTLI